MKKKKNNPPFKLEDLILLNEEKWRAKFENDWSDLIDALRNNPEGLGRDSEAREMIASKLEGSYKKPNFRSKDLVRNLMIIKHIGCMISFGMPAYRNNSTRPTACSIAAQKFNLSPEAARDIWKKRRKFLDADPRILESLLMHMSFWKQLNILNEGFPPNLDLVEKLELELKALSEDEQDSLYLKTRVYVDELLDWR